MPIKYVCRSCDTILYEKGTPMHRGKYLRTPQEVIDDWEGTCPRCHQELVFNESEIEVRISDSNDYCVVKM
ncbi:MAG: hypothetical protein NWE83_04610 [Candidatus Bathyarchaeota archaeon]|nr:hypothetical protein [Candidatus Bathyarchaeota archaeon]